MRDASPADGRRAPWKSTQVSRFEFGARQEVHDREPPHTCTPEPTRHTERDLGKVCSALGQRGRTYQYLLAMRFCYLHALLPSRHRALRMMAGGACAGVGGCVLHLHYLHEQYQLVKMAEPHGPMQGMAAYLRERRLGATTVTGSVSAAVAAAVGRKAPAEVQQQQQPEHQQPAAPAHRPPRPRRNILFVGDSLVTGVGCDADSGPTMPRACAEFLSRALRVDVKWTAIGKTGADVAGVRA